MARQILSEDYEGVGQTIQFHGYWGTKDSGHSQRRNFPANEMLALRPLFFLLRPFPIVGCWLAAYF
jgi:hypothetical protein